MNIREFFVDDKITIPFKLFGLTHLFLMTIVVVATIIIFLNRKRINQLPIKTKKIITKSIAIILLLNMLTLYISSIIFHNFDYKDMLPFHLCYIANYFYIIPILFNKEHLLKYTYFLSLLGPIPAIIFFNVPSMWESFNFYLYVISHHVLVIGSLLTFYMYPKKIKFKDTINLAIALNILYVVMSIFNYYTGSNYCFSGGIPSFILDLFPFLVYIPTTIILEVTEIFILVILFKFYNKEYTKINNSNKQIIKFL